VVAVTRAGGIEGAATVSTDYDDGAAAVARKVRVRTGATAWRTLAPGPHAALASVPTPDPFGREEQP
jgi:hypothetical protein